MKIDEILDMRPGDVIFNIKTKEAQVVKEIHGTPDKGYVCWRDGGSTPTNPHLQSIDYVSLMRDRFVGLTDEELEKVEPGTILATMPLATDDIVPVYIVYRGLVPGFNGAKTRFVNYAAEYNPITGEFTVNDSQKIHYGQSSNVRLANYQEETVMERIMKERGYYFDSTSLNVLNDSIDLGNPSVIDSDFGRGEVIIRNLDGRQLAVVKEMVKTWKK